MYVSENKPTAVSSPPPPPPPNLLGLETQGTHREWHWPLSSVHSSLMEKLAQAGEVGGSMHCPPPFTISTVTYKVVVSLLLRGQKQSPYFYSTPICTLWIEIYPNHTTSAVLIVAKYSRRVNPLYNRKGELSQSLYPSFSVVKLRGDAALRR